MRVNEAFVISLPERPERLQQLRAALPGDWPLPSPQLWPGVREEPPPWWLSSEGAWGCRQAHLSLLKHQWERGIESTLVLEDDAVLCEGFSRVWTQFQRHVPSYWDMVMLGGQHVSPPRPVGTKLVRCVDTRRTHAYIIRLRAIPLLARTWGKARRHIDHSLSEFASGAWVYAPPTWLIGQNHGWSDISNKENLQVRFWTRAVEDTTGLELDRTGHRRQETP